MVNKIHYIKVNSLSDLYVNETLYNDQDIITIVFILDQDISNELDDNNKLTEYLMNFKAISVIVINCEIQQKVIDILTLFDICLEKDNDVDVEQEVKQYINKVYGEKKMDTIWMIMKMFRKYKSALSLQNEEVEDIEAQHFCQLVLKNYNGVKNESGI